MNEKPKRDQNPPALDFVTALTPQECVERLKDAAFSTIDHQLSIRANEREFVVEKPGVSYSTGAYSTLQCRGQFSSDSRGTRVVGRADEVNKSDIDSGGKVVGFAALGLFAVYAGISTLLMFNYGYWLFGVLCIGVIAAGTMWAVVKYEEKIEQRDKAKRDLEQWVQQTLSTSKDNQ